MNKEEQSRRGEDVIAGRNAVTEALRSGRPIDSLYVARGAHTGSIGALIAKAKKQGIPVKEADAKKLDYLCGNAVHQGVVALAAAHTYASLDDLFALAQERGRRFLSWRMNWRTRTTSGPSSGPRSARAPMG